MGVSQRQRTPGGGVWVDTKLLKHFLVDARYLKFGTIWRGGHCGRVVSVGLNVGVRGVWVKFDVTVALLIIGNDVHLAGRFRWSGRGG